MALNKSKGNMYDFVTHTWNTVKGDCLHGCSYCYMAAMRKRFKKETLPPYFDESELKTNLGSGNYIFVGSSNDLFCDGYPKEWIIKTLDHCAKYPNNKYLFQSKNPKKILDFIWHPVFETSVVCTTLETNRWYPKYMNNSSTPDFRAEAMKEIDQYIRTCITIEPIMDFDTDKFIQMIWACHPFQVNIGADSGRNNLPEPDRSKILDLIYRLESLGIDVYQKSNLKRILGKNGINIKSE